LIIVSSTPLGVLIKMVGSMQGIFLLEGKLASSVLLRGEVSANMITGIFNI
jgi:hypothetical protein